MNTDTLASAYQHCLELAHSHYENFPVASRLLPGRLRRPIAVIYAFARRADDLADEGDAPPEQRLSALEGFDEQLDAIGAGRPSDDPVFIALADVIRSHSLPLKLFHDLLSAFAQDVTKKRYANFNEVIDYCRRSANPVGRLLLHLHDSATPDNLYRSDAVCTALQLINFLQDICQDLDENDRIYLPQDEMREFGVTEAQLAQNSTDEALRGLINLQLVRARSMLLTGVPLGKNLRGRFGLEIRMIIEGGLTVLRKLELALAGDAFARPRLTRLEALGLFWRALVKR